MGGQAPLEGHRRAGGPPGSQGKETLERVKVMEILLYGSDTLVDRTLRSVYPFSRWEGGGLEATH